MLAWKAGRRVSTPSFTRVIVFLYQHIGVFARVSHEGVVLRKSILTELCAFIPARWLVSCGHSFLVSPPRKRTKNFAPKISYRLPHRPPKDHTNHRTNLNETSPRTSTRNSIKNKNRTKE